ncbi:MAG: CdaR family protein [Oscillospiraceae bacterium]
MIRNSKDSFERKGRKISSAILSLVIAFGLWLYVVNNVSKEDDITFNNIPVVREGESILNEQNLMITELSTETVSLHLAGSRDDLNKIDSSNTSVKINLSNIKEPGEKIPLTYTPSYPATVANTAFEVVNKSPSVIFVSVDYRRTFEIPVVVKWTGTRSENYLYDTENFTLDYSTVTITGPASVADQIDHAQILIDLTDRSESFSESFRYTLCDAEGNPVNAKQITTSVEEILLSVQILQIREIDLVADVTYGGGATAANTKITLSPEVIRVSGGAAVLEELGDTYTVCAINLADIEKSSNELKYTITLPEGVTNQTGVSEVVVTVRFTGLKTRDLVVDKIEMINVPEGMTAEIINANLTVRVRGPEEEIAALTEKDISAVVDLSAAEAGTATYKALIKISDKFPNVGAMKTSSVSATVLPVES